MAQAAPKEFKKVLLGKETVMSDNNFDLLDHKTNKDKKAKKIRKANSIAYELLLVIMDESTVTGRVACRIVSGYKTQFLEDRDACFSIEKVE